MQRQGHELAWRIGGPQGSGIDRLATVFGRACASYGLNVFGRREYHSNIIGRHSYFDFCISPEPISSHRESPDIVVTFDTESLCRHLDSVADGAYVLFAAEDTDVPLHSLPFLDERIKTALSNKLAENSLPQTTAGMLEHARARGIHTLATPYSNLLAAVAHDCGLTKRQAERAVNTLAVAVSAALLGFADTVLLAELERTFGKNPSIYNMNASAVTQAYAFVAAHHGMPIGPPWLHNQSMQHEALFITGSQSVALGKLAAGLSFQTYYPISPASDESVFLEQQPPIPLSNGGHFAPLVLQVEDELAAATMACGAALTGARSATSTSGPGFCLMTESLGWAGMNEVPLVISLYQRGGPSTGLPTRTEQGDLQFAIHAGHGEFPRLVLASGDIEECFYDALRSFDYAERYQLPVIHMLDKALASSSQSIPPLQYEDWRLDRGKRVDTHDGDVAGVSRFELTPSGISPRPLLGQEGAQHWLTGAEHDTDGQVSEDPEVREQMMNKRARKLQQILTDLSRDEKLRLYGDEKTRFTVLTWGSSKGAVWDAVQRMLAIGIDIRAIQVRLMWPFPTEELTALLQYASPLVVVENNHSGQLNSLLREHVGRGVDHMVVKYNGRPMSGDALFTALHAIHAGNGVPRTVIHNSVE